MSDSEVPNDANLEPEPEESASVTRPRIWTVFLTVVVALVLSVVTQAVVGGVMVANLLASGVAPQDLQKELIPKLMSPPVFIGMLILGQVGLIASAFIAAKLSPVPVAKRLGLVRPRCPNWAHAVFVLGSVLPLALGVGAAYLMTFLVDPDESVMLLYKQMTQTWAIPFIVAIGLFPGVCEEILFRGYIQQRFIERWGPWPGIFVTSVVFGLFHVTPHAIALAFILGIWLGAMAYRTGSIWSGALCHGCVNSGWNIWQVGKQLWGFPVARDSTIVIIAMASRSGRASSRQSVMATLFRFPVARDSTIVIIAMAARSGRASSRRSVMATLFRFPVARDLRRGSSPWQRVLVGLHHGGA